MQKIGFKIGRSLPGLMAIVASTIAGLGTWGWILGRCSDYPGLALVTGGVAFSLILASLVAAITYRGAGARVRAEDALRDSEERFRLFVEGATDYAIILLDPDGYVVSWNAGADRVKGYKSEEIIGRSFSLFYTPEDLAAGVPAVELKLATERGRWEVDGWRVRADGTRFWANVLITALKDDAGNLRGFSKLTRDITERKLAEEALLKAGALQSAIFNSANFSSIATDAKGIIQIFNVGAERMLGYAAAEVMNKITPADISDPQEIIARAVALSLELRTSITPGFESLVFKASHGIEDIYELTYVRKDGSRFPAVVSVTALRDAQDAIIGYLLIGTDNTARKRAEEALLKAGALQSAIFNSANFSSIATDAKGIIQIFNVGAERMLGYAAAEVMNKITPADISDPLEIIARAETLSLELRTPIAPGFEALVFKASRGIEDIYELTYVRKDGSRFPAVVSVTALRDAQDAIIGYLLIGTDNTARKLADEALRKNEAQLHTIIENLDEGVLVCDLDGALLHSNHAAQELRGYSGLEESCGHMGGFAETFELLALEGRVLPRDEWPLARILRGEKLHGVEVRVRRMDADWQRVFSYSGTLVQDAGGHPLMAIATFSNITERRQAADVIHQINTDLERRVVERTAQLQTANHELEAFCYSVSHDLRAPLRTLDGFSQALLEDYSDKLDAHGQNYLGRIRAGSQRMGQLIDDLLSLSRVSRGEVSRELVDLSKMAHEVADELRASAPQRNAEFVVADGLIAETDARLLRIVLTNLFGNAWKFTAKQQHARIEFGATGENRGREYFMRDNGAGFDQAYSSKLFGAFQRLHAASDFPGTGIGLATVQRIIQRQGGRVWAEGKVEQGATFHFTL
jgi:PAS domain S-box-containing protein